MVRLRFLIAQLARLEPQTPHRIPVCPCHTSLTHYIRMPFELKELAAISGMPGLHRLIRPARHGVLVESLAERPVRTLAPAKNKVSLLSEISIYTEDLDVTVPLTEVFERMYQQHGATLPVTVKSGESELSSFLGGVVPDYDRERVYQSDIKKLVTWYSLISQHLPYQPVAPEAEAAEPTAEEPLSTGGVISALDAEPTPTSNPEAATSASEKTDEKPE